MKKASKQVTALNDIDKELTTFITDLDILLLLVEDLLKKLHTIETSEHPV